MTDAATVPDFEGFDWSRGRAEKNWDKHRVNPVEAEQVFFNSPLLASADHAHSPSEKRFFVLGQTDAERELFVAFALWTKRIRIVSARDMSRQERRIYKS